MEETFDAGQHWRIVLEPHSEGTYIFVFEREDSSFPERDELVDSMSSAKECCEQDYGTKPTSWHSYSGHSLY